MIRQVRVILSAEVDRFTGGIRNALGSFSGFASTVATGARSVISFFSDIGNIVSGVSHGITMLAGAARGLWDTFIQGAISEERLAMTMKFMSGSAQTASDIMTRLDDWIVKTGTDGDDAEEAILDMAKALRATDGAVDPDKLFQTMDLMKRLSIATGMSLSEMSKIVGRALTGDVEMLARTLGISREKLAELSPEFAKFMSSAQGAGEAQLGAVTRLGGQTEQIAGDALKALDEVANALGATEGALDEYANTTEGKLLTLQGLWENFTENVGDELLPIISKALEKIINFVEEHQDEIANFVDQFGDIATEGFDALMEWIDSGAAKKLVDDLSKFSSDSWVAFADAIGAIDWEAVAATVNAIAGLFKPSEKSWEEMNAAEQRQDIIKKTVPAAADALDKALTAANTGQSPAEAAGDWISENLPNFPGFNPNTDIGKMLQDLFKVEVKVSVDNNGNLQAYVENTSQKAAENAVGDLVNGIAGTKAEVQ